MSVEVTSPPISVSINLHSFSVKGRLYNVFIYFEHLRVVFEYVTSIPGPWSGIFLHFW